MLYKNVVLFFEFQREALIYFLTFLIYFLKNPAAKRPAKKIVIFFEYFQKIKRFRYIFDQKTLKIVLFFDLFFENRFLKIVDLFFEKHQTL